MCWQQMYLMLQEVRHFSVGPTEGSVLFCKYHFNSEMNANAIHSIDFGLHRKQALHNPISGPDVFQKMGLK